MCNLSCEHQHYFIGWHFIFSGKEYSLSLSLSLHLSYQCPQRKIVECICLLLMKWYERWRRWLKRTRYKTRLILECFNNGSSNWYSGALTSVEYKMLSLLLSWKVKSKWWPNHWFFLCPIKTLNKYHESLIKNYSASSDVNDCKIAH